MHQRPKHQPAGNFSREVFVLYGAKVATTGAAFVTHALLARLLGTRPYGDYVLVLTWVNLLAMIGGLGTGEVATRFVASYASRGDFALLRGVQRFVHLRSLAGGLSVAALAALALLTLGNSMRPDLMRVCVFALLLVPIQSLITARSGVLKGLHKVLAAQLSSDSLRWLVILAGIAMVYVFTPPFDATRAMGLAILAGLICLATLTVLTGLNARAHSPAADRQMNAGEWGSTGISLLFVSGFGFINSQADILLLGMLRDTTETGLYAAASRIALLAAFGMTALNAIVAPKVAAYFGSGDTGMVQHALRDAAKLLVLYVVPMIAATALAAPWLLGFFGPEFTAAVPALLILLAGQLVNVLCGPVALVLNMVGRQQLVAKVFGAFAVLNLALNLVLIPKFGMMGAGAASAVTLALWNITLYIVARTTLHLEPGATALFGKPS